VVTATFTALTGPDRLQMGYVIQRFQSKIQAYRLTVRPASGAHDEKSITACR
jgi:hypothetical protein